MNLIKNLFLGGVLLSTCSFTNNVSLKSTNFDFRYYTDSLLSAGINCEFKYGQKFVLAEVEDQGRGHYTIDVVKTTDNVPYAVINNSRDVNKYLVNKTGWNTYQSHYKLFPIGEYKASTTTFSSFSSFTDYVWGLPTEDGNESEYGQLVMDNTNFKVDQVDNYAPVINGYQGVYLSNVNNPITVNDVKSQLKATDDLDGDLTSAIKIDSDNFTGNESKVGKYNVTFSVQDKAGNKATLTIEIHVIDADLPVFTGPSTFTSNLSNKLTLESIKSQIKVTDNYDKNITYTVENDEFSGNESKPGKYKIKFKAVDSSDNVAFKEVTVTVVDDIKPTISGNASYRTSYDQKITLDTLKQGLTVSDNFDKLNTSNLVLVEDTYTTNYNKSGTYHVKFKVSDSGGNESEIFDITITVVDEKLPVFEVSDYIINLDHFTTLTKDQILELLKNSGQIDMDRVSNPDEQIQLVEDNYGGTEEPGKYKMKLSVTYDDGETKDINFTINKLANPNSITLPWYQVAWNWCMDYIFEPVINFFKNIGKTIASWFK